MAFEVDARLTKLRAEQRGFITMAQARALGVHYDSLRRRRKAGSLTERARGVLADAWLEDGFEERVRASVLAAGDNAFASHETAAQLWELPLPQPAQLEITTLIERRPRIADVRLHRSGLLVERDITVVRAILITTPERTIVDLSSRFSVHQLGRMTDDALRRRITTLWRIRATAERLPRAPGRSPKKLGELLDRRLPGVDERESLLEDFVFAALRRFGLPLPVCQHKVVVKGVPRRIDCCYPDDWLALETLGFEFHGLRARWDDDALRGNELQLAGFRVLHFTSAFTDRQIAEQVAEALGRRCEAAPGPDVTFSEWSASR
jgi:putative AbiEi antitoxin of type IV toxin-antitoxin system